METSVKPHKTSHKTVINPVKRPSKQPQPQITVYNQSRTLNLGCVLRPLGSPTDLQKRLFGSVHRVPAAWHQRCTGGCTGDGYGTRVGRGRGIPVAHHGARKEVP